MHETPYPPLASADIRVGTVIRAQWHPDAKTPGLMVWADFGEGTGIQKAYVQGTALYTPDSLQGMQVIGVITRPPNPTAPVAAECLLTGFPDAWGNTVLATPERYVPDGATLCQPLS